MNFVHNDRYVLFMMIYKPSKLIYSSVHIDRLYHFIQRSFFTNTFTYVYQFLTDPLQGTLEMTISSSQLESYLPSGHYLYAEHLYDQSVPSMFIHQRCVCECVFVCNHWTLQQLHYQNCSMNRNKFWETEKHFQETRKHFFGIRETILETGKHFWVTRGDPFLEFLVISVLKFLILRNKNPKT